MYEESERNPCDGNIPLVDRQSKIKIANNAEERLMHAYGSYLEGSKMIRLIAKPQ